ncbi:MAG TPA: hypothetical protein VMV24_00065 [Candidatus Dormibacteraeota bacterium]|nr:hypothetical protein [Candidatus Dormibacteraeota bacterium]
MGLNNTEHALLIILSVFLAIFLILSIIALAYFLSFLRSIKRTSKEIISAIDKTAEITNMIKKSIPLIGMFRYFSKLNKTKKTN